MNDEFVLIEKRSNGIACLIMNRPAVRNSLSLLMLKQMYQAIIDLGACKNVYVIILTANGCGFCAGHDLKELTAARQHTDKGLVFFKQTMQHCTRLMMAIVQCPKPVIASVHGVATAAGCQLVASCDLAIATSEARFATPGVNIGLFCSTPMVALSRNIAPKMLMEMLLTGDMIKAEIALQAGLINKIVETKNLDQATNELAHKIASKAPAIIKIGKEAFYQQAQMPLAEAYRYASDVMVLNMLEPDAQTGMAAFIEKRIAQWRPL